MVIGAAILVGMLLNLRRINPIAALVYTAVINGVAAVPLLVLILLVANKRAIVGAHVNGRLANSHRMRATLVMEAAVIALAVSCFWR